MTLPHLAPAEREREYSPSSCIGGNYRPFIDAYAKLSRQARERSTALGARWIEGRYGHAPSQRLDLCLPAGAAPAGGRPLLVFIHGGYWQELSAADSLFAAAACAERGAAFAALDYTLAPAARVGDIVGECRAALSWLLTHCDVWGLDGDRIVVAGSSAGAHLAAMVCLAGAVSPARLGHPAGRHGDRPTWRPRGAVLVSGVYELEPLIGTSINEALGLDAAAAAAVSPLRLPARALHGFAPSVLCWGEVETMAFKQQSRAFAAALQAADNPCTTFEVAARNHFDVILDLADAHTLLGRATFALLAAQ